MITSWKEYAQYCDENCCFTDVQIDNDLVFILNDFICAQLKSHGLENLVVEVCKFALPTSDGVPHLLTSKTSAMKKIKQLFVPLKNSKSFMISQTVQRKERLFGANTTNDDDDGTPKKKGKKAKAKAKTPKTKGSLAKKASSSSVAHVSETACFLEDAQNMMESTLSTVETEKIDKELCNGVMSKMIEFGFEGTVEVIALGKGKEAIPETKIKDQFFDDMAPQQTFTTWSKLREHIAKIIRLHHLKHMAALAQDSQDEKKEEKEEEEEDGDDDAIPEGLNEQDVKDMVELEKTNVFDSVAQVLDKNPIDDLEAWLKIDDNLQLSNMLKRAHQAFNSTNNLLWRTLNQESFLNKIAELENVEARAEHVATTVAKAVWDSMPAKCFLMCQKTVNAIPARLENESEQEFAVRFDKLLEELLECPRFNRMAWKSFEGCQRFMRMRVVHFVAMLSETSQMLQSLQTSKRSHCEATMPMQELGAYLEERTGVMSKSWLNIEALAFDIDNLADWNSMWARVTIKAKQMHGSIFLGERTSEDWDRETGALVKQGNKLNKAALLQALKLDEKEAAGKQKADLVEEYAKKMIEAKKSEEKAQKEAWLDAQSALIQLASAASSGVDEGIERGIANLKAPQHEKGVYVQVFPRDLYSKADSDKMALFHNVLGHAQMTLGLIAQAQGVDVLEGICGIYSKMILNKNKLVKGDRIFVSGTTKQRLMFFGRVTCMPSVEQTTFERAVDAGYFHHGGVKYDLVLVPGMQLAPLPINIAWNARVLGSLSEEEPTAIPHTVHYNVSTTNRAMNIIGTEGLPEGCSRSDGSDEAPVDGDIMYRLTVTWLETILSSSACEEGEQGIEGCAAMEVTRLAFPREKLANKKRDLVKSAEEKAEEKKAAQAAKAARRSVEHILM